MSGDLLNSCVNCPVAWDNFRNLTAEELMLINENRFEATFRPGEILIKQGLPATSAVFISRGIAKAFVQGPDQSSSIVEILLPTNLIIGPGVQVQQHYTCSVAALTTVHSCIISFDVINMLIKKNAEFASGMIRDLSAKSFNMHNRIVSLTHKKMAGRLAEALLFFSEKVFNSTIFDIILTRQELGEYTNMAMESVVRILKEFDSTGVIKSDCSKIQILDMERLKYISENG